MTAYDTAAQAISGILGYWPLDETSGTSADDKVGSNDGTYVGTPTLNQPGAMGGQNGVQMNGTSHDLTIPINGYTGLTAISLFGWYQPIPGGTSGGAQAFRNNTSTGGTGWILNVAAAGTPFRINSNDGALPWYDDDRFSNAIGRFWCLTYDGTTARYWIDGELWGESAITTSVSSFSTNSPLHMGRNGSTASSYSAGIWAGVGIANRVIDASEVQTLYQAGKHSPYIDMVRAGTAVPSGAGSHVAATPTGARPGDRVIYLVSAKPDTLTAPSATNGYTVIKSGTGGTGSAGTDTGPVMGWLIAKDITDWNDTAPTVTFTGTGNSLVSRPLIYRPAPGYAWTDAIATDVGWAQSVSDTNTASPLSGTLPSFTNNPTAGDALAVHVTSSTDAGSSITWTNTATGLTLASEPRQTVAATSTGNDISAWDGGHYQLSGTASTALTISATIVGNANHSGLAWGVHLRQTPKAATTVVGSPAGPVTSVETALPGTVSVGTPGGSRFYIPASGSPAVTPTGYGAAWDTTASVTVRPMPTTPSNTALSTLGVAEAVTTNPYDVLVWAGVSDVLAPQMIDGYFVVNIGAQESNAAADDMLQCVVRVIQSDGSERGVLYAGTTQATVNPTVPADFLEFGTVSTLLLRTIRGTLSGVTAQTGDRLVVELGYRATNASATSRTGTLRVGDPTAGSDLPYVVTYDEVTNSGRCWIEFEQDMFNATVPADGSGSLTLSGSGTHSSVATASLALSAAGDSSASPAASASLSLSGAGSAATETGASASLTLSASGAGEVGASGAGSLTLTGAGDLSGTRDVSGSASIDLSGALTTSAPTDAAASLSLSGSGGPAASGSSTADLTLSGAGAGTATEVAVGAAALSLSGAGNASQARSGSASLLLTAVGSAPVPRSGTATLTLLFRTTTVVVGVVTAQGAGRVTIVDATVETSVAMRITILDPVVERAPTSITVVLSGGQAQTDVTFDIDGTDVYTVSADSNGMLGPTSLNLTATLGAAGTHTVTATQITDAGTITDSADFEVLRAPALYPQVIGLDAAPVLVAAALTTENGVQVRHWVLQDLLAEVDGGIGSYVFPHNPGTMTSPHLEHALNSRHSTASDGKAHIFEGGPFVKEWTFGGFCPSQEHQENIEAYRDLNRRFWVIDHRNRAWKVMFTNAEFEPRRRQNVNGVDTDWGSDFTVTATVFDQAHSIPEEA